MGEVTINGNLSKYEKKDDNDDDDKFNVVLSLGVHFVCVLYGDHLQRVNDDKQKTGGADTALKLKQHQHENLMWLLP